MGIRRTLLDDDYDRFAENLFHKYPNLNSKEDFFEAGFQYLEDENKVKKSDKQRLIEGAYRRAVNNPNISPTKRKVLKKATQKKIQDVKQQKVPTKRIVRQKGKPVKKYSYDIPATQKGKTIFVRRIKTKKGFRYIDNKGRFASPKNK